VGADRKKKIHVVRDFSVNNPNITRYIVEIKEK